MLTTPTVTDEMLGIVLIVKITIRQRQNTCITKMVVTPGELQLLLQGSYCVTWVVKKEEKATDTSQRQVSFRHFQRGYHVYIAFTYALCEGCVFEYAQNAVFCNAL